MTLHARYGKLQTPAWPVFMCLAPSVNDSLSTSRYGEQLTLNQWVLGSSPRWCTKKSRNECCGFFVAPFPPGRTHTSRKRSCSSRGDWSLNSVRRTEFLTRPLMVHQSTRCKKLQRVFYCNLSKKVQSGAPSGDENSSGPPPVRRAKTPQWGVFRARESPRW